MAIYVVSHRKRAALFLMSALAVSILGLQSPGFAQSKTVAPASLASVPTVYAIGYSHLDTEWCWSYPQVINEFIPDTLHQNFDLFKKYPDYIFNWTGANRYKFMKEYYPADFATLKKYVASGQWYPNGSSLEEGDVDLPSEESVIRQVMYGNDFFDHEFGVRASDFMLPDCFGFPASLPSILAHCGVDGFSTQKLTWGSAVGIPFNVGVWVGPDGQSVYAALNGGSYTQEMPANFNQDADWRQRLADDKARSGLSVDYRYYGVGDRGGAARDSDAANLESDLASNGPIRVVSSRADQMFKDLKSADTSRLPHYQGDLLLTHHTSGTTTSAAEMKRWNHENEKLADAAERASVAADWLGAEPYDKARITDGWWKFLPGQFHDLMAGTALPKSYEFAWNDQVLAMNEFAGVLQNAVGGVASGLDTSGPGVPVVVYNALSRSRQDVVEASVILPNSQPGAVQVHGPGGQAIPAQEIGRTGATVKLLFLATVPSAGYAVYHVTGSGASAAAADLKVSTGGLENAQYSVKLDGAGDIVSIFDKRSGKELLSAPARLAFQHENPSEYPAWNMDWEDQSAPAEGYVDGPAKISVVENGPVRVAVQVDRWSRGSHVVQTIRLSSGDAGNRVEFLDTIDWMSKECALMEVLPLTVSNPLATYNWELGTIQRATDDPTRYEVPAHQWFDLTDTGGSYGVSVLSGDRYGSDKPDDHTLRLTLLYTPGTRGGYHHQGTQDWGHHDLLYGLTGHAGDWRSAGSQWTAMRLDRPLIAFQSAAHPGPLGTAFSFVHTNNLNVSVEALKQAEASHEIVVRFNELAGRPQSNVECRFAAPIVSAREVDGQERPMGGASVHNGALVFDMSAYRPRAFAVTLAPPSRPLAGPESVAVRLPYNANVEKPFGSASGGSFDSDGDALPADMLPARLVSGGVPFRLAPKGAADDAVVCAGQTVDIPSMPHGVLYLLAASNAGDVDAEFGVGGQNVKRTIQSWNGMVGQWDDRIWQGPVPELTYDVTNPMVGLNPGYIKLAPVAWYSDHLRSADGSNAAYSYCYLFRYAIPLPAGSGSVVLPDNKAVTILAATVASNPADAVFPVRPLYDTLAHSITSDPHIDARPSDAGDSQSIAIDPPLYFQPDGTLHYTLDGSTPTAESAVYTTPILISQTASVKAAYIEDGRTTGMSSATAVVDHPTPPHVVAAASSPQLVVVTFSEPVSSATAENVANYQITPAVSITSASLSPDGQTVSLQLAAGPAGGQAATLSVDGVTSALPNGLAISHSAPIAILAPEVAFQSDAVQSFNGASPGVSTDVPGLPAQAGSRWTINLFTYFNSMPGDLTLLGGFGDASDNTGTQRYLGKFPDGVHFWGSNVDVGAGTQFDIGKWQMITATFDGTDVKLYKNGVIIATAPASFQDAASTVKIAAPGPWDDRGHLDGKIAGFRIWKSALNAQQVASLMSAMPGG